MTLENNQEQDVEIQDIDQSEEATKAEADKKKISNQIPKKRFDEVNEKYKAASKELDEFRAAQAKTEKKKLEEEGNYKELLAQKDKEIEEVRSSLETQKRDNELEKLKSKSINLLNKEGIIDGDDGLRFLKFDDVLESDSPDDVLSEMVKGLKDSKSYLFQKPGSKRSESENGVPGGYQPNSNTKQIPQDPFDQAFSKVYQK